MEWKTHRIRVTRAVRVEAERAVVRDLLNDYALLPSYEHKLRRIDVRGVRDGGTEVGIAGRFARLPFRARLFFTRREDGGFDSFALKSPPLVRFSGSFVVREADRSGCVVTHVERYDFRGGPFGRLLGGLLRPWIGRSMDGELRRLKRLAEEPALVTRARRGAPVKGDARVPVRDPWLRPRTA